MEKKRKRASFSPTITIEPDIYKDEVEEKKPTISQMVEVVVEQKGAKKSAPPPKINIVMPRNNPHQAVEIDAEDEEEEESVRLVEKRLPVSTQVVEEVVEDDEVEAVKEEREEERPQAKHHQAAKVAQESKEDDEAETQEEEEEVKPKSRHTQEEENEEVSKEDEEEIKSDEDEVEVVADATIHKKTTQTMEQEEKEAQKSTVAELFGSKSSGSMPEITIHKSTNNKSLIIWAITMVAIAIGVGGGLVLFTSSNLEMPAVSAKPTPSLAPKTTAVPAASPTPTKPAVNKADVSVQVQNGGGKVGAGSKMKAFLESAGYTVDDVGNASSYNFEETEIVVKASVAALLPTLEADLGDEYTLGTSKTTLPETSTYDVRIIVGKN